MAVLAPNLSKFDTVLGGRVTDAVQLAAQKLIAHEVNQALRTRGPRCVRAAEQVPLRVDRVNVHTAQSLMGRQFRITVDLFIDDMDLQDLQRY